MERRQKTGLSTGQRERVTEAISRIRRIRFSLCGEGGVGGTRKGEGSGNYSQFKDSETLQ